MQRYPLLWIDAPSRWRLLFDMRMAHSDRAVLWTDSRLLLMTELEWTRGKN